MTHLPKLQHQLDGSATSGEDCGVRVASMACDFASEGDVIPSKAVIRARMQQVRGPTTATQQERAVESYDQPHETKGRFPFRYQLMIDEPIEKLVTALENGRRWACVQIDYAVVNDLAPSKSGDRAFRGKHSIGAFGMRGPEGKRLVRIWDPLDDGRRAGIPEGPIWWPLHLLVKAAESFVGTPGQWSGGLVPVSPLIDEHPEPEPEPEPPPPPTCEEQLADALDLMEEADMLADELAALLPKPAKASVKDGAA